MSSSAFKPYYRHTINEAVMCTIEEVRRGGIQRSLYGHALLKGTATLRSNIYLRAHAFLAGPESFGRHRHYVLIESSTAARISVAPEVSDGLLG